MLSWVKVIERILLVMDEQKHLKNVFCQIRILFSVLLRRQGALG